MFLSIQMVEGSCMRKSRVISYVLMLSCVVLILSACSSRQLGYRYAEQLISWQVGRYVTLDSEQRSLLREEVDGFLQWHAETEMPEYLLALHQLYRDANRSEITEDDLYHHAQQMGAFWLSARTALVQPSIRLLSTLNDDQVDELFTAIEERRQERRDEARERSQDEIYEMRQNSMEGQVREFMGRPNRGQRDLISAWSRQLESVGPMWTEYNDRWFAEFQIAMDERGDTELFAQRIEALWVEPEALRSPEMDPILQANTEVTMAMMVQLHGSMTDRQRQRLMRNIDGYRRDIMGMMRQRGALPQ